MGRVKEGRKMKAIVEQLVTPLKYEDFQCEYFNKKPLSLPFTASDFRGLLSWSLLFSILEKHSNCWLPKKGYLPAQPDLARGMITPAEAVNAYKQGHTVLVRHAEQAHLQLKYIANDFEVFFNAPVDIQLYYTPRCSQGFDWHYDIEDVFVIQSIGSKEFRLKKNTVSEKPFAVSNMQKDFFAEPPAAESRCLLEAGDMLYIPAGWWHCAEAATDSAHLSIGVLNPQRHLDQTPQKACSPAYERIFF